MLWVMELVVLFVWYPVPDLFSEPNRRFFYAEVWFMEMSTNWVEEEASFEEVKKAAMECQWTIHERAVTLPTASQQAVQVQIIIVTNYYTDWLLLRNLSFLAVIYTSEPKVSSSKAYRLNFLVSSQSAVCSYIPWSVFDITFAFRSRNSFLPNSGQTRRWVIIFHWLIECFDLLQCVYSSLIVHFKYMSKGD